MAEALEVERRARADRHSILMAELVKCGKTMDDVAAAFRLLDNVEQMINAMWPGTQNAPQLSMAMAGKIWTDEEVLNLIHAVREVWTAQMANPTSLRIWDLIWMKLVQAGIQCSNLEAKFKWDSVFSDQILIAGCLERLGPESYWRMTLYDWTRSGLPADFPRLWFDEIAAFIRWKTLAWVTGTARGPSS
ncbi:hypothetical protein R1sor_015164 [Riccia sorocarpa]|uniref:Uncharacterized protein n=1 Tax=Riccia sorocarpa TaxID=122646 RepID=A0ABD3HER6_9MARC